VHPGGYPDERCWWWLWVGCTNALKATSGRCSSGPAHGCAGPTRSCRAHRARCQA
jgi:hypothetical protein